MTTRRIVLSIPLMRLILTLGILPSAALGQSTQAQDFPSKPITIIIPYGPGSSMDVLGRRMAEELQKKKKWSVIVDNKPGANGIIGTQHVQKAPADGHTILFSVHAVMALNPHVYKKLPYDPIEDFEPVAMIGSGPYVLISSRSLPVTNLPELIALAKKSPEKIMYGSYGVGSGLHLAGELLNREAKIKMTHVPYKTGSINDVVSGQLPISFESIITALPFIKSNKVNALGVTLKEELPILPGVPPISKYLPDYEVNSWVAMFAPKNTPPNVINSLTSAFMDVMSAEHIRSFTAGIGLKASPGDAGLLKRRLAIDYVHAKDIADAVGMRLD